MKALDLFCGAGGATRGYQLAGFHVTGVDINTQPNYVGDDFIKADAMTFPLAGFDLIHASPPCQAYSAMSVCRPDIADRYPKLIGPVRERLRAAGLPYVIENVPGAPLHTTTELCGHMFGLDLYRHRLFESNYRLQCPSHPEHVRSTLDAGRWRPGTIMSVVGHCAPIAEARRAMGIDWMSRDELVEAIPPAYTRYVGWQFQCRRLLSAGVA